MVKSKPAAFSASEIIARRKQLWEQKADLDTDQAFREAVAAQLLGSAGGSLRQEVAANPELLIEMCMVIVNKDGETVPFFANTAQRAFQERLNAAIREQAEGKRFSIAFIILKGRQQGFTSWITGYQLATSLLTKNFSGYTVADNSDNSETIFTDKAKYPYDSLPEQLKPVEKYNTRRELHFERLNSRWRVATAGMKDLARSKTLHMVHGSEVAFWTGLKGILNGLKPALTPRSIKLLESTANGFNDFKELWDDGENEWQQMFFEWWLTEEYSFGFEGAEAEQDFMRLLTEARDLYRRSRAGEQATPAAWIWERCRWLLDDVGLSMGQVYWYYKQWATLRDHVKQEYPCTPEEAFLASGTCVFDAEVLVRRIKQLTDEPPVVAVGSFLITWNDAEAKDRITRFEFREHPGGMIRVLRKPRPYLPYVIGGDTKGEGRDKFSAAVMDNITGQYEATLWGNPDASTYAHQLYCLGMWYNSALIGIEMNFNTHPIEELQRLNYPKQYVREQTDTYTGALQKRYGFRTDGNTRPLIISKMQEKIAGQIEAFFDVDMLRECLTFVFDKNGRPDAESSKHDDLIFAHMIAEEIRDQQTRLLSAQTFDLAELPQDLQDDYYNADAEGKGYLLRKWGFIEDSKAGDGR